MSILGVCLEIIRWEGNEKRIEILVRMEKKNSNMSKDSSYLHTSYKACLREHTFEQHTAFFPVLCNISPNLLNWHNKINGVGRTPSLEMGGYILNYLTCNICIKI